MVIRVSGRGGTHCDDCSFGDHGHGLGMHDDAIGVLDTLYRLFEKNAVTEFIGQGECEAL